MKAVEVLWKGDGWKITTQNPDSSNKLDVWACHIDCTLEEESTLGGMSWGWGDIMYEGLDYHACYGCKARVPDSVLTLMSLYVGFE